MPTAPLKYCAKQGCSAKVPHGRCAQHARKPWQGQTQQQRITGRQLQALRARLFDRQPLCVVCQARGRVTLATIRDHIVPLAEGGADTDDNTQALCAACSDAKTQKESARGRQRWR
jgi:5-methylcytosine-specific restriction protein A